MWKEARAPLEPIPTKDFNNPEERNTVMVGNISEEHKWSQNTFSASLRLKIETKADHKYWLSTTYPSGRVLSSEQIMVKTNDKAPAQH